MKLYRSHSVFSRGGSAVLALLCNLALIVLEVLALGEDLLSGNLDIFRYYTQDSNLLALLSSLLFVISIVLALLCGRESVPRWVKCLRYAATCCLTVTFLVVVFVLAPAFGFREMLLEGKMLYLHAVCPLVSLLSLLCFEREPGLFPIHTLLALVPTVIYAVVSITLNILRVWEGPYPFLMVYEQSVLASIGWCIAIVGGAYLLAVLLWRLGGKAERSTI